MKTKFFPTPEEAEAAFYEAFEQADLEAMMGTWSTEEDIVCVHPQGGTLAGFDAVRESWRQVFSEGQKLRFRIVNHHKFTGLLLAIHVVHENVRLEGGDESPHPIIATNVYMRNEQGWRMILHHASPSPPEAADRVSHERRVLH
jgi:ketosteroid isomerase-like protein